MKKLLSLLALIPLFTYAQETKDQLKTRFDVIRNETSTGGNTKVRIANAHQEAADAAQSVYYLSNVLGTNTYTSTLQGLDSYADKWFVLEIPNENSGASTLNINGLGAINIQKFEEGWVNVESGELFAGRVYIFAFDGTRMQVVNGGSGSGGGGGTWGSITGTFSDQTDAYNYINQHLQGKEFLNVPDPAFDGYAIVWNDGSDSWDYQLPGFNGNYTSPDDDGFVWNDTDNSLDYKSEPLSLGGNSLVYKNYSDNYIAGIGVQSVPTTGDDGKVFVYNESLDVWELETPSGGGVPTSRAINTTSPLAGGGDLTADRTLSIANAAADGSTKGAAAFNSSDFDATTGVVSTDYNNGQSSTNSTKGYLPAADFVAFNGGGRLVQLNSQTTNYTLVAADAGKKVLMSSASANTVTLPPNSSVAFAIGTKVIFTQLDVGVTSAAAGVGVVLRNSGPTLSIGDQYASLVATKIDTDEWLIENGTAAGVTAAALTKVDDTNVTATLGGTPSTALLQAVSITLGWTGQLAVGRGGLGLSSVAAGDILWGSATNTYSARNVLNTTPTALFHLKAGTATASTAPLKFTSGTNLTSAEAGAMEYDGSVFYLSPSTTRYRVMIGLTGSTTVDVTSVSAGTTGTTTATVTGAAVGDPVYVGASAITAGIIFTAQVTATNTVTIYLTNPTSGALDPPSATYSVRVIKTP